MSRDVSTRFDQMDTLGVDERIRDFYKHSIKKLEEALERGIKEELPRCDFGLGEVSFDPDDVSALLEKLDDFFLAVQKVGAVDEQRKRALVTEWRLLAHDVEEKRKLEQLYEVLKRIDGLGVEKELLRLSEEKDLIEEKILRILKEKEENIAEIRDMYNKRVAVAEKELSQLQSEFGKLGVGILEIVNMPYESSDEEIAAMKADWLRQEKFWKRKELLATFRVSEMKRELYFKMQEKQNYIDRLKNWFTDKKSEFSVYFDDLEEKERKNISECERKIQVCQRDIADRHDALIMKNRIENENKVFEATFDEFLSVLIAHPLAADTNVPVASLPGGFELQRAMVKTEADGSQFLKTQYKDKGENSNNGVTVSVSESEEKREMKERVDGTRQDDCISRGDAGETAGGSGSAADEENEDEEENIHPPVVLGNGVNQATNKSGKVTLGDAKQQTGRSQMNSGAASILGTDIVSDKRVRLKQNNRLKGLYIIGKTGSGKTTLLVNLILQDIEQGMGVCFLTPHADAITDILKRLRPSEREQDVILLDPMDKTHAFGLNLFQCNDPTDQEEVSRVISSVVEIFAKLFTQSGDLMKDAPNMAETLQMALPVLLAQQSPRMTLAEIPLLTMDPTARANLLEPLLNPGVELFWKTYGKWNRKDQDTLTGSTRKRVNDFLMNPLVFQIIGQSETTVNFRQIMDERKILLVKLPRKPEIVTSLIGSILIEQLASAAFSREDILRDERVQFNLYADEYQRFCTPTFAELLTELRKYKIATCVAHQFRDQLDKANRGATLNATNLVVYQVSGEDAEELAAQFQRTPPPPAVEWIEEEDGTELIRAVSQQPFNQLLVSHNDSAVRELTRKLLVPLEAAIKQAAPVNRENPFHWCAKHLSDKIFVSRQHRFKKGWYFAAHTVGRSAASGEIIYIYFATLEQLLAGKQLINQLLIDIMEGRLGGESFTRAIPDRIVEIISVLRGYLGLQPELTWKEEYAEGWIGEYSTSRWVKTKSSDRGEWLPYKLDADTTRTLNVFVSRLGTNQSVPSLFTQNAKINSARTNFRASRRLSHVAEYRQYFLDTEIERFVNSVEGQQRWQEIIESTKEGIAALAEAETAAVGTFADNLYQLCEAFTNADNHILVRTGQESPRLRKHPVITQRSYPEMESKIANELANPPQPFAARVKLGTKEHTIRALPFSKPDAESVWMARQDRIIEQTRKGYCKKREEVNEEIETRQDELRKKQRGQTTSDQEEYA